METEQSKQLSVKLQQLDGKLRMLSGIEKEILDKCDINTIEWEIDNFEAVFARILECKECIFEVIKSSAVAPAATVVTVPIESA